jgi:hypothetical protein
MKQTKTISVVFKNKHEPGTEEQLEQILRGHLESKGVRYEWGVLIV